MQICFDSISKTYPSKDRPIQAVEDISFQLVPGRVYGLLGPNGSGKSSLMRMLLNLIEPDFGTISVDGDSKGNSYQQFRNEVGYLPEERGFYRNDKLQDVLVYLGQLKGLDFSDARKRAQQLLDRFELKDYARKSIASLSKGMSQKVQLIAAVIHRPSLLILDEPFTGLDPVNLEVVRELILEQKKAGATTLLSTHQLAEAEKLCDEIIMLQGGKTLFCGTLQDLQTLHGRAEVTIRPSLSAAVLSTLQTVEPISASEKLILQDGFTVNDFLRELTRVNHDILDLRVQPTSLENLYLKFVRAKDA